MLAAFAFWVAAGAASAQDLSAMLGPIRARHDVPALAGAIVTSQGVKITGAVGVRKYGAETKVTRDDRFHLGSETKAMTAVLLATLVEQGKLTWKTPLFQVLPRFAKTMHPKHRGVTVEQLVTHRAGMSPESWPSGKTGADLHALKGGPRDQRREYLDMILSEPPAFEPGSKYVYSNRNYVIAGVIAEELADRPWEELMNERLFAPLGMTTCGFGAMGSAGKVDQPWQHIVDGDKKVPVEPSPTSDNPIALAPAGLVHCSLGDWGKFIAVILQAERGQSGFLKAETYKLMTAAPGDYQGGWLVTSRPWAGGRTLTHAGSNTMNYAVAWLAPLKDFAVLAATNQGGDAAAAACDEASAALSSFHQVQDK